MNNQIIQNVFEFWKHVGALNNGLNESQNYTTVSVEDSEWPNRVFDFEQNTELIEEIVQQCKSGSIPQIMLVEKPNELAQHSDMEFVFGQKNMALDYENLEEKTIENKHIKRAKTADDATHFAETASIAFNYTICSKVVEEIVLHSQQTRLFLYQEQDTYLGCGIVFFDSNNNAGLHMIGTLPEGRGKGIGKSMTEKLMQEGNKENKKQCVLHASLMGESIYRKLGFEPFGEIETYRIKVK